MFTESSECESQVSWLHITQATICSGAAFEPLVEQIHYSKSHDQLEAQVGFGISHGVPRLYDSLVI